MLIDKKDVRETKGEKNSKEALIWVRSLWKKNNNLIRKAKPMEEM